MEHVQGSAKVDAPGCVNAAGKLGRRSDVMKFTKPGAPTLTVLCTRLSIFLLSTLGTNAIIEKDVREGVILNLVSIALLPLIEFANFIKEVCVW